MRPKSLSENARQCIGEILLRCSINNKNPNYEHYADEIIKIVEDEFNKGKVPELPTLNELKKVVDRYRL